ncbi:SWIM zinc finger family protein [Frankia canadensis]|nr:SWIM zinc finger family protein [Frankia canadensis]
MAASGHSDWSRRFLALIEELGMTGAVRGGRRLVRAGAVISVRRSGNLVVALVRDGEDEVHKARLAFGTFSGGQWARLERALAARAGYAASLLAGTVPADIDRVFTALGLSPLPTGADDLAMDCSCPDWQRPCAHLAAACHALAEHLDRDPFEVLALRGRERDVLLDGLRTHRGIPAPVPDTQPGEAATEADGSSTAAPDPGVFWTGGILRPVDDLGSSGDGGSGADAESGADAGSGRVPAGPPDGLLDQCGPLVVDGSADLRDVLRPAYAAFTRVARNAATDPPPTAS